MFLLVLPRGNQRFSYNSLYVVHSGQEAKPGRGETGGMMNSSTVEKKEMLKCSCNCASKENIAYVNIE